MGGMGLVCLLRKTYALHWTVSRSCSQMLSSKCVENRGNRIHFVGLRCWFLVSLVSDIWFEADLGRVVLLIVARQHVEFLRTSSILSRVLKGI